MKFVGRFLASVAASVLALGAASAPTLARTTEADRHPIAAQGDLPLLAVWGSALEGGRLEDIANFVLLYPDSEYSALAYQILEADVGGTTQIEAPSLGDWSPPQAKQVPVNSILVAY